MKLQILPVAEWEAEPARQSPEGTISSVFSVNCYAGRTASAGVILKTLSNKGQVLDSCVVQVSSRDGKMKLIRLKKVLAQADEGGAK